MGGPIRILHAIGSHGPGGAEKMFLRLYRAQQARPREFEARALVRKGSWIAERLTAMNLPFETAPFGGFFDLVTRRRISASVRAFDPAIVQTWMSRASSFLPRLPGRAVIARLGGYYSMKYYRRCTHLIGITTDLQRYFIAEGWPPERTSVIANFADPPQGNFRDRGRALRTQMGIPYEAQVIFIAARLHKNKGLDTALRALALLPSSVHLLIAGSGPEEASLKSLAQDLTVSNRVHFTGWMEDTSTGYGAGDLFLMSSRHEPLGSILFEAWSHDLPLIATNTIGTQCAVRAGEDALVVPVDEAPAMAKAIMRVFNDPALAQRLITAGRASYEARHTEAVIVAAYDALYRRLAK